MYGMLKLSLSIYSLGMYKENAYILESICNIIVKMIRQNKQSDHKSFNYSILSSLTPFNSEKSASQAFLSNPCKS